jgi:hypothetical protein
MTEGIGRATLGRVSSTGVRPPAPAREVVEEAVEAVSGDSAATVDTGRDGDVETRNRLRRALRILLAARRRDDGASPRNGS